MGRVRLSRCADAEAGLAGELASVVVGAGFGVPLILAGHGCDLAGDVVGDAGDDGGGAFEHGGWRGRRGPSQVDFWQNLMLLK